MKRIEIDGVVVEVRENLWAALRRLAPDNSVRVLWIDALSINQFNTEERNHQVAQMGQVFSKAKQVAVWLGESDEHSSNVFQLLSNVSQWKKICHSPDNHPTEVRALKAFCERKYWKRLWIIQELLLARDIYVYCGEDSCKWFRLWWFLQTVEKSSPALAHDWRLGEYSNLPSHQNIFAAICPSKSLLPFRIKDMKTPQTNWRVYHPGPPLMKLVQEYGDSECEDRRDKIFGLSGLAPVCCKEATPIDYSISWQELYQKSWHHFYSHILYLDLHHHYIRDPLTNPILTYQILDQRLQFETPIAISIISLMRENLLHLSRERIFTASETISSYCSIRGSILSVDRPQIEKETSTATSGSSGFTNMNVAQLKYIEWILLNRSYRHLSITQEYDLVDSIKGERLALEDIWTDHHGIKHQEESHSRSTFSLPGIEELQAVPSRTMKEFDRIICEVKKAIPNCSAERCSVALEKNGMVCIVPRQSQVGDLICEFASSNILVILRAHELPYKTPYTEHPWTKYRVIGRAINFVKAPPDQSFSIADSISIGRQTFDPSRRVLLDLDVEAFQVLTRVSATPNVIPS